MKNADLLVLHLDRLGRVGHLSVEVVSGHEPPQRVPHLHITRDTRDTRDTWHAITHHVDVLDVAAVLGQVHEVDVPGVEGCHDYGDNNDDK